MVTFITTTTNGDTYYSIGHAQDSGCETVILHNFNMVNGELIKVY